MDAKELLLLELKNYVDVNLKQPKRQGENQIETPFFPSETGMTTKR
jgi:hypothetical protein